MALLKTRVTVTILVYVLVLWGGTTSQQGPRVLTSCGFDKDFCSFVQDSMDSPHPLSSQTGTHDWERRDRPTFTDNTGPSSPHQGTGYAFVDASHPMKAGDSVRLLSPVLRYSGEVCVDFWYHMYGKHIKELRLYKQRGFNSQQRQDSFSIKGEQGDQWKRTQQTVRLDTIEDRIGFSATRGDGYEGDIAIDTVVVYKGTCEETGTSGTDNAGTSSETNLPFNCTFESGICGMSQRTSDDFDWTRQSGPTQSGDTGPKGAQSGDHYLYIEASRPQETRDKAYLESPQLGQSYTGPVCVSFCYHMFEKGGSDRSMGSLKVFQATQGEGQVLFTREGNQNNTWHYARETVHISEEEERIVFLGIVGDGYHGDIAIDDISIVKGHCSAKESEDIKTNKLELPFTCGFESDLCGLIQGDEGVFNWTRHTGKTSTKDTGPGGATEGEFYVYAEASYPRTQGDTATLTTPPVSNYTGLVCIHFKYHMYDKTQSHMGSLKMYTSRTGPDQPIFEKSGDQGDNWFSAEVEENLNSEEKITFSATVGSGLRSDIGLDQIQITEGDCRGGGEHLKALPFRCGFEEDLCGMQHEVSGVSYNWTRQEGGTLTTGTGPAKAYQGKYYMYTEASHPRQPGDNAILSTPAFQSSEEVCVEFFYHMLDDTSRSMGSLNVYSRTQEDSRNTLFTKEKGQGNEWIKGRFQYDLQEGDKFLFSGVRGQGMQSDIGLDLVTITQGSCEETEESGAEITDLPYRCDFEEGLCGMIQDRKDGDNEFNWTRYTRSTPSSQTGPGQALSGSYYIYMEVSGHQSGHTASISTPELNHWGVVCISFYYHMYGEDIGTLSVYKQRQASEGTTLLNVTGNQGNTWKTAVVETSINRGEQIRFSGRTVGGVLGDIALDLIKVTRGSCDKSDTTTITTTTGEIPINLPLSCDFEEDLCELVQTSGNQLNWTRHSGRTQSQNTGPESAQSGLYYVYVEMSDVSGGRRKQTGDKGSLETPALYYNGKVCVEFYYHALGSSLGSFSVYRESQGQDGAPVFEVTEDQGTEWTHTEVETRLDYGEKLYFVAVRGSSVYGDIALDSLTIRQGTCEKPDLTTETVGGVNTTPISGILPISCDLEEDFCDLQQDSNDDFDWSRQTGTTLSQSTGPDKAYSGSYYMYIEASRVSTGATASIVTPELLYEGSVCVCFHYHMYGSGMGALKVYSSSQNRQGEPLFERTGNQSNKWMAAEIETELTLGDRIHFVGVRGTSIRSDLAVDKIHIYRGACQKTATLPLTCSFETDLCGWSLTGQSNWTRHSGGTPSTNTGPKSAYSGTYYIYTEASGTQEGDRFIIETPIFEEATEASLCIKFNYHMYGSDMGTLAVYRNSQSEGNLLFEKSGNHGNEWVHAEIQAASGTDQKVLFVGTRGSGVTGDIALDELFISAGECMKETSPEKDLVSLSCGFEVDLCRLEQKSGYQLNWTRHSGETPSANTGPSGAQDGDYYLYIEASGASLGDLAYLGTPAVIVERGLVCVQFYYHMYGSDIGSLRVYRNDEEDLQSEDSLLTERNGNQANKWEKIELETRLEKNEKIVIIGERGSGFQGDIAIDNFQLTMGRCGQSASSDTELVNLPYLCGFEEGLCGMEQATTDQLDWTRVSSGTTSVKTGPEEAASGLYYVYVEASGVKQGHKAMLQTPRFNHSGSVCVQFDYHMFGSDMGTLQLYRGDTDGGNEAVFTKTGSQSEAWMKEKREVFITHGEKLTFLATVGSGIKSDIAIDGLDITAGPCNQETAQEMLSCGFEDGLCTFTQSTEDQLDWIRVTGSTPSSDTGPKKAHSGTYYIYLEASGKRQGDKASLATENFRQNGDVCLSFYYHMYGDDVGSLEVAHVLEGEQEVLYELSGNHGDEWKKAQISAAVQQEGKVVFQGVRGNEFRGDISLDDIKMTSGSCDEKTSITLPFGCDFERDMCDFLQSTEDQYDWLRKEESTSAELTGPDGASSGSYYILAGGREKEEGQTTVLLTPALHYNGTVCLSMDYHMFDSTEEEMGYLTVYRSTGEESEDVHQLVQLYKQTGSHGDDWNTEHIQTDIEEGDQILIIAERGAGPNSDIGLDNVNITTGSCESVTSPTEGREGQVSLPYSCTFESGMCNMRQKYNDDFDWMRKNTPTETRGTGPDEAQNGDYYLYAESSIPRQEGHKAVIETPELLHSGMACISFYYQMFDEGSEEMGELRLHLNKRTDNSPVFQVAGNQGYAWKPIRINQPIKNKEQLVFIATRGPGFRSDIAIDVLHILPYSCEEADSMSTTPAGSKSEDFVLNMLSCDMERSGREETLCRLRQDRSDQLQWVQGQGHTPSGYMLKSADGLSNAVTGPRSAHQGDYYIYIEASVSEPGMSARLLLEGTLTQVLGYNCLRFFYIMNGFHIGSLSVYSKRHGLYYTLWMMSGHQSTKWQEAAVEVNTRQVTEIGFVGTTSDGFSGDIALDDIRMTAGKCQSSSSQYLFECTFEMDDKVPTLCGMEQETTDTLHFDWILWSRNTPSDETGPAGAYSGQYYIYAEASKPRQKGDQARILLPKLDHSGPVCVEFHYYMYGHHMGQLEVYTQDTRGERRDSHMTLRGPQGDEWLVRRVTVPEIDDNDQIGFRAIRGAEFSADIALDSVKVTRGSC